MIYACSRSQKQPRENLAKCVAQNHSNFTAKIILVSEPKLPSDSCAGGGQNLASDSSWATQVVFLVSKYGNPSNGMRFFLAFHYWLTLLLRNRQDRVERTRAGIFPFFPIVVRVLFSRRIVFSLTTFFSLPFFYPP